MASGSSVPPAGDEGNRVTLALAPKFTEPLAPDAAPITELHRGNDGFVAFQRHDASGKFESLFSVRASELPELLSLSDRIVVLRRGRVAASLEKKDFSREGLRLALDG